MNIAISMTERYPTHAARRREDGMSEADQLEMNLMELTDWVRRRLVQNPTLTAEFSERGDDMVVTLKTCFDTVDREYVVACAGSVRQLVKTALTALTTR